MTDTEKIRKRYLPDRVRLLFVGESPPANGRFFYCGDPMTMYTARAFEHAYRRPPFGDSEEFLLFFKEHGCYLDDISLAPVNAMSKADRRAQLKACQVDLSRRIRQLNPEVVVAILRRIEPIVREAIALAGIAPVVEVVCFPGQGYQKEFVSALSEILQRTLLVDPR